MRRLYGHRSFKLAERNVSWEFPGWQREILSSRHQANPCSYFECSLNCFMSSAVLTSTSNNFLCVLVHYIISFLVKCFSISFHSSQFNLLPKIPSGSCACMWNGSINNSIVQEWPLYFFFFFVSWHLCEGKNYIYGWTTCACINRQKLHSILYSLTLFLSVCKSTDVQEYAAEEMKSSQFLSTKQVSRIDH